MAERIFYCPITWITTVRASRIRRSKHAGVVRHAEIVQDSLASRVAESRYSLLSHLRPPLDVRHTAQCRRRCGQVGHAVAPTGRCEGIQEVLADEATDETRGVDQIESSGKLRRIEFWHSANKLSR